MAVQSRDIGVDLPINKIIAALMWLVGVGTTYAAIAVLLGDAPWYIAVASSLAMQAGLTAVEYKFYNGGQKNEVGLIALFIDVAFNAGGLYGPMSRIGATPTGNALSDAFGVAPNVGKIAALVLAVVIGYLLARAPEYIWESD